MNEYDNLTLTKPLVFSWHHLTFSLLQFTVCLSRFRPGFSKKISCFGQFVIIQIVQFFWEILNLAFCCTCKPYPFHVGFSTPVFPTRHGNLTCWNESLQKISTYSYQNLEKNIQYSRSHVTNFNLYFGYFLQSLILVINVKNIPFVANQVGSTVNYTNVVCGSTVRI